MANVIAFPDRAHGFARERLIEARQAVQMSRAELAREVGVSGQAIGYYESGERRPDMEQLLKIAAVLKQPVSFFLRPPSFTQGNFSARFFRSVGPKSNKLNLALDVRTKWLCELVQFILRNVRLPSPNLPCIPSPSGVGGAYSLADIEAAATATRRHWKMGDGPIANVVALLETQGAIVSRLEIGTEKIDSFSCWIDGRPYILLGSDKGSSVRSRLDACHELGHLLLHADVSQEDLESKRTRDRIEREAQQFAGAFLLPRGTFLSEFYSTRQTHLLGMKRRWGASMHAIVYRAMELGALDEADYISFRKRLTNTKQLTTEELDNEIPLEQPRLLLKAWKVLTDRQIVRDNGLEDQIGFSLEMISDLYGTIPNSAPVVTEPELFDRLVK